MLVGMDTSPDRRWFLRIAAGAFAAGLTGCAPDRGGKGTRTGPGSAGGGGPGAGTLTGDRGSASRAGSSADRPTVVVGRPIVRPRASGSVWIATPPATRPVAYVSMASRRVFVDRAYRDRASWLLDAHISVSTWVWRIPLPGDSPRTPIPPGDEPREFEELPIGRWDPSVEPAEGDVRIVLGRPVVSAIEVRCVPVQGTSEMLEAGRLEVVRCHPDPMAEPVREDFRRIGSGHRHADPECGGVGHPVDVLGWAVLG